MRFALAAGLALALAGSARASTPASADLSGPGALRLSLAGFGAQPEQTLPALAETLHLDTAVAGGGDGRRAEPALALVLGVIPGFGLGHFYAGAKGEATTWLIIDLALLGGSIVIWTLAGQPFDTLVLVAWLVERGFEGYFAFRAAGGHMAALPAPGDGALASLDPRSRTAIAWAF